MSADEAESDWLAGSGGNMIAENAFRGALGSVLIARGQVTERFLRAVELLGQSGDDQQPVRIGAVHALEQIVTDAPELHWQIIQLLTAYVRSRAHAHDGEAGATSLRPDEPFAHDVQAIATMLANRDHDRDPLGQRLDFRAAWLERASLDGARLDGANLAGAHLDGASLRGAHLIRANLASACLKGADLFGAWLTNARFNGAQLEGVELTGACLDGATLREARMSGARLRGAHLRNADLTGADLDGADLWNAEIDGADLAGVDLTAVRNLTRQQLRSARRVDTAHLPAQLLRTRRRRRAP